MRASNNRYFIAPLFTFLGIISLLFFQNCSSDVGFDADPSATQIATPVDGQDINTDSPTSGNGDIIIQINEFPKDSTSDTGAVIDYEVTTPEGTITSVECMLNGAAVACDPTDRIEIPNTGKGPQTFTITATNSDGKTVTESIDWTVYNRVVQKTKDFNVNVVADKVDIIINVDNSGSMEYEQQNMASKVANFMQPFAGLDYHIAITTTSPIGNTEVWKESLNYVDGKFAPLDDAGTYCIKSSVHSQAQAQAYIENNVVRDLFLRNDDGTKLEKDGRTYAEGNGWERGIYTTRRAFERDISGLQGDTDCIRNSDIPKHVILISDEDETLVQEDAQNNPVGGPLPEQDKSSGDKLRNYVAANYGANTVFKFHSIIVNPYSDEGVRCLENEGRALGVDYAKLSVDTGGYIGSVCAQDYSTQLGEIGKIISNSSLAEALGCTAVVKDDSGDYGNVVNLADNQEVGVPYEFKADKVEFSQYLPRGDYRITFYCFE